MYSYLHAHANIRMRTRSSFSDSLLSRAAESAAGCSTQRRRTCVHVHACVLGFVCACARMCTRVQVRACAHVCMCPFVRMFTYVSIYMYVFAAACVYVYVYVYVHVGIPTYRCTCVSSHVPSCMQTHARTSPWWRCAAAVVRLSASQFLQRLFDLAGDGHAQLCGLLVELLGVRFSS